LRSFCTLISARFLVSESNQQLWMSFFPINLQSQGNFMNLHPVPHQASTLWSKFWWLTWAPGRVKCIYLDSITLMIYGHMVTMLKDKGHKLGGVLSWSLQSLLPNCLEYEVIDSLLNTRKFWGALRRTIGLDCMGIPGRVLGQSFWCLRQIFDEDLCEVAGHKNGCRLEGVVFQIPLDIPWDAAWTL
jgi:hypothetical protein